MRVALINEEKCENIVVFNTLEEAKDFFKEKYIVTECPPDYGINDYYTMSCVWVKKDDYVFKTCPDCGTDTVQSTKVCKVCGYIFES